MAGASAGCQPTLMTRGPIPLPADKASRRKSFAAVRSRLGDSMKSMVSPAESTAVEVGPAPGDPDIGFIDPPGAIGAAQLATNALIQNVRIPLQPAPDPDVV